MRALALAIFLGLGLAQVEIPLWHTLGEGVFLEAEAEAFNRSQGRFRILPRFVGDYRELGVLLAAALRNGTAPPVAQVELGFLPVLALEGLAVPLPPPGIPGLDPALLRLGEVGGRLYGYPVGVSVAVLFYNREAFGARGLSPPKDFAELRRVARALSTRSAKGLLFSADVYSFAALVLAQGGRLAQAGRPALDGEGALRALEYLEALKRQGVLQVRAATEVLAAGADFLRTKAFMALGPSTLLRAVEGRTRLPFAIGLAPLPLEPQGRVAASGSVLVAFRHASPEAREGLLAFYRHLAEGHRQLALARSTLYLPLNLEAQEAWRKEEVGRLLLGQKPRLAPWHQEAPLLLWAPPLEEALEKALKGNVPPQKALEEAQARASRMP